jgi:hypothetical protein
MNKNMSTVENKMWAGFSKMTTAEITAEMENHRMKEDGSGNTFLFLVCWEYLEYLKVCDGPARSATEGLQKLYAARA